jgi:outer membrane lipoprotein-sorting protein
MITGIHHKILLFSVLAVQCVNTVVADSEQTITKVFNQLTKHLPSDVHYLEKKHIQFLDQEINETGILRYRKPDILIREQHKPEKQRFEISTDKLVIIKKNEKRTIPLDKAPALRAISELFRATLSGDLPRLRKHYKLQFSGTHKQWKLTLYPHNSDLMNYISYVTISGKDYSIKRYELHEADGDWSEIVLKPIKESINISPNKK